MGNLQIDIQPMTYIDPDDLSVRIFSGGTINIIPTETVREDGARLYTDIFGHAIVYIKEGATASDEMARGE